jgi:hypothetical protein
MFHGKMRLFQPDFAGLPASERFIRRTGHNKAMDIAYYKRFRMEIRLSGRVFSPLPPSPSYRFLPWEDSLLNAFSRAKFLSFRNEFDANVFPCLADFAGCKRLMKEIVRKPGFLPDATWLAIHMPSPGIPPSYCGTVQGVCDKYGLGAIQNLGVAPEHRCAGLGTSLLLHALAGFRRSGIQRVYLEVTAQNDEAIRLYRRVGFTILRTVYKTIEAECTT